MTFSGYLLCLHIILFHCCVAPGERTKLPRYAFDPDYKPAIVGSYSYDVVKGKFILPDRNSSTTDINLTDIILSTTSTTASIADESFRKHEGAKLNSFNWWTRSRLLLSKNSSATVKGTIAVK